MSACSSEVGLDYACRYADLLFYHESWRRNIADVLERLPPQPARIQAWAEAQGRRIKTVITPHVICRETEKKVADLCRAIVEAEDAVAADGLMGTQKCGD